MLDKGELRKKLLQAEGFDDKVLQTVYDAKWQQIWVPKEYGGLGYSFSEGLKVLEHVSEIDGSLGWFVTLCSGANYFSRNLKPEIAQKLFKQPDICFGGSGMLGGNAEKIGDSYLINGLWNYATGAPYLTHFTLNAQIVKNGIPLVDNEGQPEFRSFILDAPQVKLIPSWKSMGMVATASHSFTVENQYVPQENSFIYNSFFTSDPLNHIPFGIFADLTLLVNYLGMANHFLECSFMIKTETIQGAFKEYLNKASQKMHDYATKVEGCLSEKIAPDEVLVSEIHAFGEEVVESLTLYITGLYRLLGIKASVLNEEINQIFRDFFTATQHSNFRREA